MTRSVRARLFVNQMRRGRLHARSWRHVRVDGPYRPSGRNASPSGINPTNHHVADPGQSRVEHRDKAERPRAHHQSHQPRSRPAFTDSRFRPLQPCRACFGMHAQIRSVAIRPD
jgi:hypothetical protein